MSPGVGTQVRTVMVDPRIPLQRDTGIGCLGIVSRWAAEVRWQESGSAGGHTYLRSSPPPIYLIRSMVQGAYITDRSGCDDNHSLRDSTGQVCQPSPNKRAVSSGELTDSSTLAGKHRLQTRFPGIREQELVWDISDRRERLAP